MKRATLIALCALLVVPVLAQEDSIGFYSVHPALNRIRIHNFNASTTVNINTMRISHLGVVNTVSAFTFEAGSDAVLDPDETATIYLPGLMNASQGDVVLFESAGLLTDPNTMVDFLQWGAGDQGEENLAVTKGIWSEDDFMSGTQPFDRIHDDLDYNGVLSWTNNTPYNNVVTTLESQFRGDTLDPCTYFCCYYIQNALRYRWRFTDGGGTAQYAYSPLSKPHSRVMAGYTVTGVGFETFQVDVDVYKNGDWTPWGEDYPLTINYGAACKQAGEWPIDLEHTGTITEGITGWSIGPNPTNGPVRFSVNGLAEDSEPVVVNLYDVGGRLVKQQQFTPFELATGVDLNEMRDLQPGPYFFVSNAGGERLTHKVIVQ